MDESVIGVTIGVKYSCPYCGLHRALARVPARVDPVQEDVKHWFEQVLGPTLANDHARRSPGCRNREMRNIMIPLVQDREGWIGMPEQQ